MILIFQMKEGQGKKIFTASQIHEFFFLIKEPENFILMRKYQKCS